jgi:hypothetical protein
MQRKKPRGNLKTKQNKERNKKIENKGPKER